MKLLFAMMIVVFPAAVFAAGGSTQPSTTETSGTCKTGLVWDSKSRTCVAPKDSALDDHTRFEAVREYAYAGDYGSAQVVLAAMADQSDDRVLTYWGFTHRKSGNFQLGMEYYRKALRKNPDNHLARSYMGQAMVDAGHPDAARAQLTQIRARGGRQTWAEQSLAMAIRSGQGYSY